MNQLDEHQTGSISAVDERRARTAAEMGRNNPAGLKVDEIRLICEVLVSYLEQNDDVVLQSIVPKKK